MQTWMWDASRWQIVALGFVLNAGTVAASIGMWRVLVARRGVDVRPVTRRDAALALSTTMVNAAVFVAAWSVWKHHLVITPSTGWWSVIVGVAYLVVGLDVSMYGLHRLFHVDPLYGWFHRWHHIADEPRSAVTLFVMHPVEAAGFGAATIALLMVYPTPLPAVMLFFTFNLIVGTLAHVPATPQMTSRWLGGSVAHGAHHDDPSTNFGFFTQVWDRLFRTADRVVDDRPAESAKTVVQDVTTEPI